jgi:hypothetical protein
LGSDPETSLGDAHNKGLDSFINRVKYFPDPRSRIRIRIKEFKYFLPTKIVSKLPALRSGMFIPDPNLDFYPSQIPDQGVKKAPDAGSQIRTKARGSGSSTPWYLIQLTAPPRTSSSSESESSSLCSKINTVPI